MKRKGGLTSPDVLRSILRRIESGKFRPGDRLIPAVISRELGGSTIPVREALCHLAGRDILTERRNKGFIVTPVTSGMLRCFYVAHGEMMDKAFQRWPEGKALPGRTRNRWPLFAAVAARTGDEAITGVQHYLDGRLALVRAYESVDMNDENWGLAAALHSGDIATARDISARFHEQCTISCSSIWQMASDR